MTNENSIEFIRERREWLRAMQTSPQCPIQFAMRMGALARMAWGDKATNPYRGGFFAERPMMHAWRSAYDAGASA